MALRFYISPTLCPPTSMVMSVLISPYREPHCKLSSKIGHTLQVNYMFSVTLSPSSCNCCATTAQVVELVVELLLTRAAKNRLSNFSCSAEYLLQFPYQLQTCYSLYGICLPSCSLINIFFLSTSLACSTCVLNIWTRTHYFCSFSRPVSILLMRDYSSCTCLFFLQVDNEEISFEILICCSAGA